MIDRLIKYLFCAFFLLVPLSSWKVKLHGIPISVDFVLASLIILLFLIKTFLSRDRHEAIVRLKDTVISNRFWIFIAVYVFACLLSFTKSINIKASIDEMMRFLSYIFLFYIIICEARKEKYIYSILTCFLISCSAAVLFGLLQFFTGIGLDPAFNVEQYFGVSRRIASTMYNPNNFAAFIMLVSYPVLLSALHVKQKKLKAFLFVLFGLLSVDLLLTFSREGWIGYVIGFAVLALIYNKKLLYFLIILPFSLLIGSIRERILSSFDFTVYYNMSRIKLWLTGLVMIRDNPILGVGMGNSIYWYDRVTDRYHELRAGFTQYPLHNTYIKVEAETGILGILSFLAMLYYIISRTLRIHKLAENPILKGISGGFFVSMVGYLFMNFFDNILFDPQTAVFFWLAFALIIALNKVSSKAAELR